MTLPALQLDYVIVPRRPRWLGYCLLAVSLALAAEIMERYRTVQNELQRTATVNALLQNERHAKPSPVAKEQVEDQVKNAEAVVRQLALPWAPLIQTLEQAAIPEVAILQLQPEAQQHLLKITAEARTSDAMLDYLRRLTAADGFSKVHLLSHQIRQEDPQRPIQFTVQAWFRAQP